VRCGSARYSVPTRLIGASVAIVIDHGALLVVEPVTGAIVAEHELVAPGETSILDEHYDGPRPAPSRGPRPDRGRQERSHIRARGNPNRKPSKGLNRTGSAGGSNYWISTRGRSVRSSS
jgi:hypothetical protein